jgi:hypothetical protein
MASLDNMTWSTVASADLQAAAVVHPPPGIPARTPCQSAEKPQMDIFNVVLQKATRGKIGISVAAVPVCGLTASAGLMVTEIQAGGAADTHNCACPMEKMIRPGDVIVSVNEVKLNANLMHRVLAEVATSMSAQQVEVCFLRQLGQLNNGTVPRSSHTTSAKSFNSKQDGSAYGLVNSQASTDGGRSSSPCSSVDTLAAYEHFGLDAPDERHRTKVATAATKTNQNKQAKAEAPMKSKVAQEKPTTIMLGQVPGSFTRAQLETLLDQKGFAGLYDFTYVPMNLRTHKPFHYAFVNLVNGDVAVACKDALDGYAYAPDQVGNMTTAWANSQQGLQANILRYRDSPLMHESVPDQCQPAIFHRGVRVDFPAPMKDLKAPPQKRRQLVVPEVQDVPLTRLLR